MRVSGFLIIFVLIISVSISQAAGPGTVSYQGRVKTADGSIPADGFYNMRFSLYSVETGSDAENLKWEDSYTTGISVKNGMFAVQLGSKAAFPENLFIDIPELWLQVEVDIDHDGFEPEEVYSARMPLSSTPYAFHSDYASDAGMLDGKDSTEFASSSHDHNTSYYLKSEVDVFLTDKADTGHRHDDIYYTEAEIDTSLGEKADAVHDHNLVDLSGTLGDDKVDDSLTISSAGSVDAGAIKSGALTNERFSAYDDLSAEGKIDNNSDSDVLLKGQADAVYAQVGDVPPRNYEAIVAASGGDYTSLKDALDAGAKSIFIRNGTYSFSNLWIMEDGVSITGESRDGVIMDYENRNATLIVYNTEGTDYRDGTISISSGSNTVTGAGTLWSSNVSAGNYIRIGDNWHKIKTVVSDTSLTLDQTHSGIDIVNDGCRIVEMTKGFCIKNITMINAGSSAAVLSLRNVINARISNCLFINNQSTSNLRVTNVWDSVIEGNRIENAPETGMYLYFVYNSMFSGNSILNCDKGIEIFSGCGNDFMGNKANNNRYGYYITNSNSNKFNGNTGKYNRICGVYLYQSVFRNSLNGNEFTENRHGIMLNDNSDRNLLVSNICEHNDSYGVYIMSSDCDNNVVGMNLLFGNGTAAGRDEGTGTVKNSNYPGMP